MQANVFCFVSKISIIIVVSGVEPKCYLILYLHSFYQWVKMYSLLTLQVKWNQLGIQQLPHKSSINLPMHFLLTGFFYLNLWNSNSEQLSLTIPFNFGSSCFHYRIACKHYMISFSFWRVWMVIALKRKLWSCHSKQFDNFATSCTIRVHTQ